MSLWALWEEWTSSICLRIPLYFPLLVLKGFFYYFCRVSQPNGRLGSRNSPPQPPPLVGGMARRRLTRGSKSLQRAASTAIPTATPTTWRAFPSVAAPRRASGRSPRSSGVRRSACQSLKRGNQGRREMSRNDIIDSL